MGYKALDYKKGGSPFKISGPCKAAAKRKFDVYPSAYANAWGVKCTKAGGPGSMGKSEKQEGGPAEIDKKEQRLFSKKSKAAAKYKKAITKRDDARYYKDSPVSITGAKREPSKRRLERLEGRYKKRGEKLKAYQISKKQLGSFASSIDFRTKDEIKDDKKAQKKKDREDKREDRRIGRKVKRYSRIGRRKKGKNEGSGNAGLAAYRKRLQRRKKVKGAIKKVARFPGKVVGKVAAGVKGRMIARRNRRKLEGSRSGGGSGKCSGKGCGAYG